jgi:ABC-type transporter Mla subunit MlaD
MTVSALQPTPRCALDRRHKHLMKAEASPRLARDLHELYGTDEEIIERINEMLKASDKALSAVNEALRAGDGSSVHNVDKAAAILREQAEAIRPVEDQLKQLRDELSDQIAKLR